MDHSSPQDPPILPNNQGERYHFAHHYSLFQQGERAPLCASFLLLSHGRGLHSAPRYHLRNGRKDSTLRLIAHLRNGRKDSTVRRGVYPPWAEGSTVRRGVYPPGYERYTNPGMRYTNPGMRGTPTRVWGIHHPGYGRVGIHHLGYGRVYTPPWVYHLLHHPGYTTIPLYTLLVYGLRMRCSRCGTRRPWALTWVNNS